MSRAAIVLLNEYEFRSRAINCQDSYEDVSDWAREADGDFIEVTRDSGLRVTVRKTTIAQVVERRDKP